MSTVRIQVRRGTAAQWTSVNPILAAGEMGVESDSNLFKFGNGSSTWTALAYANNSDVAIGEISQDAVNQALTVGAGLTKTYNDGANTITVAVDASYFNELAQDAVANAIVAGTGTVKVYDDAANTVTLSVNDAVFATKEYVASQRSSIQNTSDSTYLFASDLGQPNGVAGLNSYSKIPAVNLDIEQTIEDQITASVIAGRGLTITHDSGAGTHTVRPAITAGASLSLTNNTGDNGITLALAPIVDATTKLITPLVQAGTVASTALTADTATLGGLTVSGNLTVNGTTTSVNSTNYTVDDPMIYIGDGNQSNVLDLGLVAAFNDGTYQHAGLVRDASDSVWKLFSGVTAEPGSTVDFTTYTKDGLEVGPLFATAANIGNVSNVELQRLDGVTSNIQTQIDSKISTADAANAYATKNNAALNNASFTGTMTIPHNTIDGASIQDGTITTQQISDTAGIGQSKISGLQAALAARAYADSPTFTGTVVLPATTTIGTLSPTELGYLDGVSSNVQTQINTAGTNLTTQVNALTTNISTSVGNLNTIVSGNKTSIETALAAETTARNTAIADANTLIGTVDAKADTKSPIASPTFTGTVTVPTLAVTGSASGITKSMVGLANVDNTTDAAKPVSTATQTALDAKLSSATAASTYAPIASPTFTGTVSGVTKTHVGLGNVDNTADAAKPVSTAQATAIATAKSEAIASATASVTSVIGGAAAALDTLGELATALGNDANFASTVTTSLASKAPIASPTFTGTVTVAASGVAFTDGTQTKAGVPSITNIPTAIAAGAVSITAGRADQFVPLTGAVVITLPASGYSTGQSIDFYQESSTGARFESTNGVVGTPGLKFRTTNSVVTAMKTSSGWLVFGDLSA